MILTMVIVHMGNVCLFSALCHVVSDKLSKKDDVDNDNFTNCLYLQTHCFARLANGDFEWVMHPFFLQQASFSAYGWSFNQRSLKGTQNTSTWWISEQIMATFFTSD